MSLTTMVEVTCPRCGESFEVLVDRSEGRRQSWTLDCEICCAPMRVMLRWGKKIQVMTEAE
jgi:uncharacterized Zn finger protein